MTRMLTKPTRKGPASEKTHGASSVGLEFKVKDLSLADWGRKEIMLAEQEMPGLMAVRAEYAKAQPLKGLRIIHERNQ